MGYNIEISVNMLKNTNFSEIEMTIKSIAEFYNCDNIYSFTEEDGTIKIPRYHSIYVVKCVYKNDMFKLLYASSLYLKSIDKELSKKYKQFIKDKHFTPNENKLLSELM